MKKVMNLLQTVKLLSPEPTWEIFIFKTKIIIYNIFTGSYIFDKNWNISAVLYTEAWKLYYNNRIYDSSSLTPKIKELRSNWICKVNDILLDIFIVPGLMHIKNNWYPDMTIQKIKLDQIPREIQGVSERPGMVNFWIGDCQFVYQK